jgi:hypothetical protein
MKEIRVKKAARNQLPQLESDRTIDLVHREMANRPEREASEEPWAGDGLQGEQSDVYADQPFCDSCHRTA